MSKKGQKTKEHTVVSYCCLTLAVQNAILVEIDISRIESLTSPCVVYFEGLSL